MFDRKLNAKKVAWTPGCGPDVDAALRLTRYFRMPPRPMGEAWFMGAKRRMFDDLMTDTPDHWTPEVLRQPLYELASGPGCFGHLPEWTAWTHFLLAQLPTRLDGASWASIYECLISAFIAHYPDERADGPYEGFYADVLATVGRIPMSAGNWLDGELAERGIISSIEKTPNGPCISSGGAFSAALFLHLKYLDQADIGSWLPSVFAIRDYIWRIKFVLWMDASSSILLGAGQPSDLEFDSGDGSGWEASWCLKGNSPCKDVDPSQVEVHFIGGSRQQLFRDAVKAHVTIADMDALNACLEVMDMQYPGTDQICNRFRRAASVIARDYGLA
ncbi:MAG TPA: hypothetical protein VFJ26_16990 [Dyella sp.]|nr:hypothetical protein [Dyella sp.]